MSSSSSSTSGSHGILWSGKELIYGSKDQKAPNARNIITDGNYLNIVANDSSGNRHGISINTGDVSAYLNQNISFFTQPNSSIGTLDNISKNLQISHDGIRGFDDSQKLTLGIGTDGTISGDTIIGKNINSDNLTASTITSTDIKSTGNLNVSGKTTTGELEVSGSSDFGNINIESLTVSGESNLKGHTVVGTNGKPVSLNVIGKIVTEDLNVNNDTILKGGLTVYGDISFENKNEIVKIETNYLLDYIKFYDKTYIGTEENPKDLEVSGKTTTKNLEVSDTITVSKIENFDSNFKVDSYGKLDAQRLHFQKELKNDIGFSVDENGNLNASTIISSGTLNVSGVSALGETSIRNLTLGDITLPDQFKWNDWKTIQSNSTNPDDNVTIYMHGGEYNYNKGSKYGAFILTDVLTLGSKNYNDYEIQVKLRIGRWCQGGYRMLGAFLIAHGSYSSDNNYLNTRQAIDIGEHAGTIFMNVAETEYDNSGRNDAMITLSGTLIASRPGEGYDVILLTIPSTENVRWCWDGSGLDDGDYADAIRRNGANHSYYRYRRFY